MNLQTQNNQLSDEFGPERHSLLPDSSHPVSPAYRSHNCSGSTSLALNEQPEGTKNVSLTKSQSILQTKWWNAGFLDWILAAKTNFKPVRRDNNDELLKPTAVLLCFCLCTSRQKHILHQVKKKKVSPSTPVICGSYFNTLGLETVYEAEHWFLDVQWSQYMGNALWW